MIQTTETPTKVKEKSMIPTLTAQQSIDAREQLQLSQTKVVSATAVPRMYLSQFEMGKRLLKDSENENLFLFYESEGWQE